MTTYKKGVLLLSDVKNYTSQSLKLGSEKTEQFLNYFESIIKPLVQTYYGYWLKRIGDGILVFFEDEINFLDFATKLRDISQEGGLDKEDFWCALRIVAHFGNFAFKELEENIGDLIGPEGIEVFRIEKYADAYDVVITEFLLSIIKNYLPVRQITSHRIGRETLKGFGEDVTLFKLVFPAKGDKIHSNILKVQMDQLELTTREIPVFGDIYPPLRMEENFINLNIQSGKVHSSTDLEVQQQDMDKLLGVNEERIHYEDDTTKIDGRKSFNVEKLYQYFKRGIILGLPGSGKTTILKYFAFREFKFNAKLNLRGSKSNNVGEKKAPRLILMIECRNVLDFDQWYSLRYGSLPIKHVPFNLETVLGYFTYCFIYHREKIETIDRELELAERIVCRSFRQGNLSILIDALDEALDVQVKNTIVEGVKLLFHEQDDLKMETEQKDHGTRIFLTSRYSEQERFLWGKNGWILQPRFEVKSLDKNQLRDLAIHFYGENQEVFNRFDDAVWREDIAMKVGGTPLTALLVIAYFEIFGHFDTRYNMYHIMVVFILVRVWKRIKEKDFEQDMRTFFKLAKSKEILKEEVEAAVIYDALSLLAYAHTDIGRVMKEADIIGVLRLFIQKEDKGNLDPDEEAEQLLKRLKEDPCWFQPDPWIMYLFILL
ncbi:MAG: hypothetical protein JSV88_29670 [Candidatus Aminicenantes bacterium]|nr:MAG: hypothetical protein JSV88_29670 [Candidatus Aminicenantes bacterium]